MSLDIYTVVWNSLIYFPYSYIYADTIHIKLSSNKRDRPRLLIPRPKRKVVHTYLAAPSDTIRRWERYFLQTDKISRSIPTFSPKSTKHRSWIMPAMMSCATA